MKNWRYIAGLLVALFLSIQPLSAFAQTRSLSSPDAAGIQVTPVVDDFTINPGATLERSIRLDGLTNNTRTYYPVVMNFEADKDTGKPVFLGENERFSKYSLSTWVTFNETSFQLTPGQRKTISYTIHAPSDATPGGHYGAVLFSTEKPKLNDEGVLVGVVGLIGTLVLATVPGDIVENLIVTSFESPRILFAPPANFKVTVGNYGNIHVRPTGGITIRNWFNKQTTYIGINDAQGAVLPESQRSFGNSWSFSWLAIGRYSANLSLAYGDGKTVAELRTFYIIPYWFIVLIGALIAMYLTRKNWGGRQKPNNVQPSSPPRRPRRIVMG